MYCPSGNTTITHYRPTHPHKQWEVHKTIDQQKQNHHLRKDSSLGWTAAFALGSVVVKTQNCLARMEAS